MLIKIQEFKRQSTYALEYHVTSGYLHAGTYTEYIRVINVLFSFLLSSQHNNALLH